MSGLENVYRQKLKFSIWKPCSRCLRQKDLPKGHKLSEKDVYLAIPLQKGQISCREFRKGELLKTSVQANSKISINDIDSPYSKNSALVKSIKERGV